MSARNSERAELEAELARLKTTPTPDAAVAKPGEDRSQHPAIQKIVQRQLERMRIEAEEILDLFTPEVRVDVQPSVIPAPVVNVEQVVVPPAEVRVSAPDQSAAILALTTTLREFIDLWSAYVAMENTPSRKTVSFTRNSQGAVTGAVISEDGS